MGTLVGKHAPDFTCAAVLANGEIVDEYCFSDAIKGKYALVFFYPLDFTFVCPSELLALHHRMDRFNALGVEVVGVSVDSHFTHNAWRNTPVDKGGIGPVGYTLAADLRHDICRAYDVESEGGVALRGAFLIDKLGTVQVQIVNNLALGRNMDELIRLFEAMQFHAEYGEVCPAGWNKGDEGMKASPDGVAGYLAEHGDAL